MKNLNLLYALLLTLFFSTQLRAQPETAPSHAPPSYAPTSVENSLLWKISGNDLETPSYLFGTIHMIPADKYVLSDLAEKTLEQSSRVVFEIDTKEMTDPSAMMGMLTKIYMANDTTLSDLISEEDYAMVDRHFEAVGLPLMFLRKVKPMFLSMLAGQDAESLGGGGSPFEMNGDLKSYELELSTLAEEQEKPITGLETIDFQMSLFDSIPYSIQATMLVETIRGLNGGEEDESINTLDEMVEMYLSEDIVAMEQLMSEEGAGIAGFEDLLLHKRNISWIPIMEEMMAEESVFFAVGAGHLGGEKGVIALLREAGYSVKPVKKK